MPREKYRVHEVAKDFGINSKEILKILDGNSPEPRKHMAALEDSELDLIFETITREHQVESFDAYFAAGEREKAQRQNAEQQVQAQTEPEETTAPAAEKPEEKKEEKTVSKKAEKTTEKPEEKPKKAKKEEKPGEKKAEAAKSQPKKEEKEKAAEKAETKAQTQTKTPAAQPKKKEKDKNKPLQARTKGETRHVDTRSSSVDLEKYNERYEQIAPANKMRDMGAQTKQKIKQKSQQYRKQGMRSSKRETEAERLKRIAAERAKKQLVIKVPDELTVGELAAMLKMTASEVIKKLFSLGVMATVNQVIDFDTAEIVATELGAKVEKQVVVSIEEQIIDDSEDKEEDLLLRDPVVVVMGHVDHGKTSILDAIRNTAVTATEAGGITQHIGAYRVECAGQMITFLDTPGHAAFTSMRARGAMATDIAVLVVAADDGIMPQTIEAINHAKAAGVQIIVAINKMDKEGANPERIKQQLTEYSLVPEEWGGDTICVPVSAKTQMGIDSLLESILLVAEVAELKANPNRAAKGVVIEARLDKGRGPIATLLVQNGTLHSGDIVVAGTAVGRVRVMVNENGRRLMQLSTQFQSAGLSSPLAEGSKKQAPRCRLKLPVLRKHRTPVTLSTQFPTKSLQDSLLNRESSRQRKNSSRHSTRLLLITSSHLLKKAK